MEALLASYSEQAVKGMDYLGPQERHHVYRTLGLTAATQPEGSLLANLILLRKPTPLGGDHDCTLKFAS